MEDRLVSLMYLLTRDYLPSGDVVALVKDVQALEGATPVFTNPHIEGFARDMVQRITNGKTNQQ